MGISLYTDFRWMPERSLVEVHWIINHLKITDRKAPIIDYGCAKGFIVRALRLMGYNAHGYDTSEYALSESGETRKYLSNNLVGQFDYGFCKDVLEHSIDLDDLLRNLIDMKDVAKKWLIIVPNAVNDKYVIKDYEKDVTHNIRIDRNNWDAIIQEAGFEIMSFNWVLYGIKNNWAKYRKGNLFYTLIS